VAVGVQVNQRDLKIRASVSSYEEIGADVYALLQQLDPARWQQGHREHIIEQLRELVGRVHHLATPKASGDQLSLWSEQFTANDTDLSELNVQQLRARLTASYDLLQAALRERGLEVRRHRPTNYLRNLYHIANGAMIIGLIQYVLNPTSMIWVAGGFVALAWIFETSRRASPWVNRLLMRVFRDVAHPDEHYTINSATWMVTALLLISLCFDPMACTVAAGILGFADPVAALVGRRYGRARLFQSKTLEGSMAFALTAALVAWVLCWSFDPALSLSAVTIIALCAAVPATLAELFAALLLDDNFSVPTVGAAGATLGYWLSAQLNLVG